MERTSVAKVMRSRGFGGGGVVGEKCPFCRRASETESKTEATEKPGRGLGEGGGVERCEGNLEEKGTSQKGQDPGEGSGGPRTQTR